MFDAQEALRAEFGDRPPHRVAVDGETRREFGLGREAGAGRMVAARDLLPEGVGDLTPQREAAAAFERMRLVPGGLSTGRRARHEHVTELRFKGGQPMTSLLLHWTFGCLEDRKSTRLNS